ncbi:hypothetical protein [Hydrogenophaga sp.]|uniref:hypothetical protein n=1 Tax=Hydrogenophaga sp. TaxID=1904254 RepID=UPI002632F048|nr:hypothetical protein [Hydrogenophaga sp.]
MQPVVSQNVTPTTAELMRWWFDPRSPRDRTGPGFHEEQRRMILQTIARHEALHGNAPARVRPVHRVALPPGIDPMRVLLALMLWQLLNRNDALAAGRDDPRFTNHFVAVAHHAAARERLFDAFCGEPVPGAHGARNFGTAGLVRQAELLIPDHRRNEVYGFVCASVCSGAQFVRQPMSDGVIAITDGRLEVLECLARLPRAVVFDDETRPPLRAPGTGNATGPAWRRHLRRMASTREGPCTQVVFARHAPGEEGGFSGF